MINFQTAPEQYKHWKLNIAGQVATLSMDVQEDVTLAEATNSSSIPTTLASTSSLRTLCSVYGSSTRKSVSWLSQLKPRIFCAGANIYMLGTSSHTSKLTSASLRMKTRCAIEDDSHNSGRRYIAALNGTASGGGYELAIACDEIYLVDDGNSAVSLPEVRCWVCCRALAASHAWFDKRKVRAIARMCFHSGGGFEGKRAKEWGLIDEPLPNQQVSGIC